MQLLYSKVILSFLEKVKRYAFEILRDEMGLKIGRSRFYIDQTSYPLHFTCFEHPTRLGYFQQELFEVGINKCFLMEKEEEVKNLLRHELAHYMTAIRFGPGVPSHGKEFRSICNLYGFCPEISKSAIPLDQGVKHQKLSAKVRKLLSLAESPNRAEGQAAAQKAQELLEKYQISLEDTPEEQLIIRSLEKKRSSAKMQAIASIVRAFHVYPVSNQGKGKVFLEIFGERTSVEVGAYVADFLDYHFEELWKEAQKKDRRLKGAAAKNSFFRGLAKGYISKKPESTALIKIEAALVAHAEKAYPFLRSCSSKYLHHSMGEKMGREKGKEMKIREGIEKKFKKLLAITLQKNL